MSPQGLTTVPATECDATHIAFLMTAALSACDAAYPLIWGSAPLGLHGQVAINGLFSPVQREGRITHKAVTAEGKVVGFATWKLPRKNAVEVNGEGGLPNDLPGVNMRLWNEKVDGPKESCRRDVNPEEDMLLSFFFVDPQYQRQGIGSVLLDWGTKKADELHAKLWVTSTPQARSTYERHGWRVKEMHEVSLERYGGVGFYRRAWMLREPM